jgi:superfamily II DNA/RNA helicase
MLTDTTIPHTFNDFSLADSLLAGVAAVGFTQPTRVQQHAIPLILKGTDVLVSAETGSGKTAAFLLPMAQILLNQPTSLFGIRALILSPTRELAQQTYQQCQQLLQFTALRCGLIMGGENFKDQQKLLRHNTAIIVATPGRLVELIEQNSVDLTQLNLLILDEADRMLDMGFSDALLSITRCCNTERQALLFSATLSHYGIIKIADKVLKNHQTLALNRHHDIHSQITQQQVLADDNEHKCRLLSWLLSNETYDKALVFTNTRARALALEPLLRAEGLRLGVLHGELAHSERQRIMTLFRDGVISILIATDLAARGLDIAGINLVINMDVPRNGIDYIHRIGRTGRAEQLGTAIVLVQSTEWNLAAGIQRFLKQKFTLRSIKALAGHYQGPKKVKGSGKAAGSKKKVVAKKTTAEKPKIRQRDQKNIGKRRAPASRND